MRIGASGLIEVALPFDPVTFAQLGTVRPAGRWQASRGCWQFPLEASGMLRQALNGRFPQTPELQQWCAWLDQPLPPLP
ncbi:MAG: ATP-dependent helicase, partial [Cyanobium sp.]